MISAPCDQVDFADPLIVEQLVSQVAALRFAFQRWLGSQTNGLQSLEAQRSLLSFLQVASVVIAHGGEVVLEWPQDSSCWLLPEVQAFEDQFDLRRVTFKGCVCPWACVAVRCAFDMPWQIMTSSNRTVEENFKPFKCTHASSVKHCQANALWPRAAQYPEAFHKVLLISLFPFSSAFQTPVLPCVPSLPQHHRECRLMCSCTSLA